MIGRVLREAWRALQAQCRSPAAAPAVDGNPLLDYFARNEGRLIFKWQHYFEIYHRHFAAFRGRAVGEVAGHMKTHVIDVRIR